MRKPDLSAASPPDRLARRSRLDHGPPLAFAAAVLVAFAALLAATLALPGDAVWPAISSLFFVLATLAALAAWRLGQPAAHRMSYWDVAGALTLFGICAGAMIDPDQMVRLVENAPRNP